MNNIVGLTTYSFSHFAKRGQVMACARGKMVGRRVPTPPQTARTPPRPSRSTAGSPAARCHAPPAATGTSHNSQFCELSCPCYLFQQFQMLPYLLNEAPEFNTGIPFHPDGYSNSRIASSSSKTSGMPTIFARTRSRPNIRRAFKIGLMPSSL